ncbi:PepSY-associated TM helix domain-containing protein [Dyadobacter bucti]|uniref:PepSY-associated TM helix domain-containing protein n=1 Tax=Dyadobacter bucti TaxID=2572203 RepID=UPI003F71D394
MTLKKLIGKLHLWLGLASGLVIFVVAVTGCIFAFEEELFRVFHSKLVHVRVPSDAGKKLPVSVLQERAQTALGGSDSITLINIYPQNDLAWEFDVFRYNEEKSANSFWDQAGLYWKKAYVDPYTGNVNGIMDMQYEFFIVTRCIHQNLFINPKIGSPIVGSATIIFVVLLLSGLVLWWPKNKAAARQRFAFRWKDTTRWKRKNYDLHNILGFYMLVFGIFIALTGIVWSFDWWENVVYRVLDGKVVQFKLPKNPDKTVSANEPVHLLDQVVARIQKDNPEYYRIFLSKNKPTNTLTAGANFKDNTLWTAYNYYMYNLSTGKEYGALLQKDKTTGQKWRNSNYDLHTGKTLGYVGMTIAFFVSLISALLPVTGFYIWLGRRKKAEKRPETLGKRGPQIRSRERVKS